MTSEPAPPKLRTRLASWSRQPHMAEVERKNKYIADAEERRKRFEMEDKMKGKH